MIQNPNLCESLGRSSSVRKSPAKVGFFLGLVQVCFFVNVHMALGITEQNAFLNIGDGAIKGNATVSGYNDQTVVQAVRYGVSQAGEWEEGEQITGRVTMFGELSVTKFMDKGSPALAHACSMKTQYDKAVLNLVAGTDPYLTVTLEKVMVTNVQVGWDSSDIRPTETITLSYRKATWRYGTSTHFYDLAAATD